MSSDLDSKNEYLRTQCVNKRSLDVADESDEVFLNIYKAVLTEADEICQKPVLNTTRELKWGIVSGNRIIKLSDILVKDEEEFLNKAYFEILGRKPDKSGYEYHLNNLKKNNISKEEFAYRLWKSAEGQKKKIEITGFSKLYADDLLEKDDKEFAEHIILQVLWRNPKMNEIHDICKEIKDGKSKEEILSNLIKTPEARNNKIKVKGLKQREKAQKIKQALFKRRRVKAVAMTFYNMAHINRIVESNERQRSEIDNLEGQVKELTRRLESSSKQVQDLRSLNVPDDYFMKLNYSLSANMTLWGPEERLHISERASVFTCFFNTNSGEIYVGDYSFAGSGVSLLTGSHDVELFGLPRRDAEESEGRDIIIGDGVWLGSDCTILGPCKIEDNAVIAAGAVVTPGTTVPAGTIYGGVPAHKISKIPVENKGGISQAMLRAMERTEGILFTEGWSEKRLHHYKGSLITGHFLFEKNAKVLLKNAAYDVRYSCSGKGTIELSVKEGENVYKHTLSDKEGSFEISSNSNIGENEIRTIEFETGVLRKDLAITIERERD